MEDVLVDGLKTRGEFSTWGAVFKHVTLKGNVGSIMISPAVDPGNATEKQQRAFDEANAAYYATVDWALDISEAEFVDATIRGVPARLVRRDPETQFVLKREKALDGRWKQLGLEEKTYWATAIANFLERGEDDMVMVAPKRARDFHDLLAGLQLLRKEGIAEPD